MSAGIVTTVGKDNREAPSSLVADSPDLGRRRRLVQSTLYWMASGLLLLAFLGPFVWILSSSFKSQAHIFADVTPLGVKTFLPTAPTLANYTSAFTTDHVGQALENSLVVSTAQVVLTLLLAVPAAYALTRLRFRGQGILFGLIFLTFMVPAEAIVIPLFQIASDLHVANSLPGVFLPFIASPFALFLLRQAFSEVPIELDEAARLDGASHLRIMLRVLLPNVRSALATLALMTFLFSWNAFLWPLIVIQSSRLQLVQVAIALNAVPGELPNWGTVFAGAVVASLPVIVLFVALQRYFVRGIVMSGLKG